MQRYRLVALPGPGLARLRHWSYGIQLWTLRELRKDAVCRLCRKPIPKKSRAYGPLTNASNRMHRLHESCVLELPETTQ